MAFCELRSNTEECRFLIITDIVHPFQPSDMNRYHGSFWPWEPTCGGGNFSAFWVARRQRGR